MKNTHEVIGILTVHDASSELQEAIEKSIDPTYRDTVLKEHLFSYDPDNYEEFLEENPGMAKEWKEILDAAQDLDCGYIRFAKS